MSRRTLIVNADDFGRSRGVNLGVIRASEEGIVTSATLMVRWPDAESAASYARRSSLSVGLHLDLGEWEYRDGEWRARYDLLDGRSQVEITEEVTRQLDHFERLVGRPPTHLDSHQHVHRDEPVRSVVLAAGERLGITVRELTPGITYSGTFYGQDGNGAPFHHAISVDALVRTIETLPLGVTELGCHPAAEADHPSTYDQERLTELETLCDPRVRAAADRAGVVLASFSDVGRPGCSSPDIFDA